MINDRLTLLRHLGVNCGRGFGPSWLLLISLLIALGVVSAVPAEALVQGL